jgi:hypothetical protein
VVDYGGVRQSSVPKIWRGVLWGLTVGNDGHVTDVRRVVHETTDLVARLACIVPLFPILSHVAGHVCAGRTSSTVKLQYC